MRVCLRFVVGFYCKKKYENEQLKGGCIKIIRKNPYCALSKETKNGMSFAST